MPDIEGPTLKEYPTFPNAPIVEAILDIQVDLPEGVTLEQVDSFQQHVKERFPEREERSKGEALLKFSEQGPSLEAASSNLIGYLYRSKSTGKIAQARLDGFTFNKLKPYEDWDAIRSESQELWDIYRGIVRPLRIKRIALRYINRIELPLPFKDFKDYILTIPEIAPVLPQALEHFLMRLVIPNPEIGATAVINEVMEDQTEQQRLPLILDIDVFKITSYQEDSNAIWEDFERLRSFKNEIFFNSITEKTKELFR